MVGILDMIAQQNAESSDPNAGLGGFFNSPVASILMPRTAARFQQMQHDQILLKQAQRKQAFALEYAKTIQDIDPMGAAAIAIDPNNFDNVFAAHNANQEWTRRHGVEQQDLLATEQRKTAADIAEEQRKNKATWELEQKKAKLLPAAQAQYQTVETGSINEAVAPKGVMANPDVQGPRPADQLQQGQTTPTPSLLVSTIEKQTGLTNLSQHEALSIVLDPAAAEKIKERRRLADQTTAENRRQTIKKVMPDGTTHTMGFNPETNLYDVDQGELPPENTLNTQTKEIMDKDGVTHVMGYNPKTKMYDVDMGLAEPKATMMLDTKTQTLVPIKKPGASDKRTETEYKGISLYEASKDQYPTAMDGFDDFANSRDTWLNKAGSILAGSDPTTTKAQLAKFGTDYAMTDKGKAARNSMQHVAQIYVYALSGQQAPEQEVNRILSLVIPDPSDGKEALLTKKRLFTSMMRTIKSRTPDGYTQETYDNAPKAGKDFKPVEMPSNEIPPMPEGAKKAGITPDDWANNPNLWLEEDQ